MLKRSLVILVMAVGAFLVVAGVANADSHTPFVPTEEECEVVREVLAEGDVDVESSGVSEREVQGYLANCFGTAAAGAEPGTTQLARTGSDNGVLIAVGAALLVLGGGAVYGSRRWGSQES